MHLKYYYLHTTRTNQVRYRKIYNVDTCLGKYLLVAGLWQVVYFIRSSNIVNCSLFRHHIIPHDWPTAAVHCASHRIVLEGGCKIQSQNIFGEVQNQIFLVKCKTRKFFSEINSPQMTRPKEELACSLFRHHIIPHDWPTAAVHCASHRIVLEGGCKIQSQNIFGEVQNQIFLVKCKTRKFFSEINSPQMTRPKEELAYISTMRHYFSRNAKNSGSASGTQGIPIKSMFIYSII